MKLLIGVPGSYTDSKTLLPEMERKFRPASKRTEIRKRTANGTLVVTVTAPIKQAFTVTYNYITVSDLYLMLYFWEAGGVWELEVEQVDGGFIPYQVMFGNDIVEREYWRKVNHPSMGWVYQNVTFILEEV